MPIARHYCPSLSYCRNKTSSLPYDSGNCWSGTCHTPPFTALELNNRRSSCRFSFQKHPGEVEAWGPRELLGLTLLSAQTWAQKKLAVRFIDPTAGVYHCLLDFPLDINHPGGAARQQKGWRPPGHRTQWSLLCFKTSQNNLDWVFSLRLQSSSTIFWRLPLCIKLQYVFIKPCKQMQIAICKCK